MAVRSLIRRLWDESPAGVILSGLIVLLVIFVGLGFTPWFQ